MVISEIFGTAVGDLKVNLLTGENISSFQKNSCTGYDAIFWKDL